jgi:excisionase family DNA binding protein
VPLLPAVVSELLEVPTPDTEALPRLLSIKQLAEHLGVPERHVRRLVAESRIPYLKWRRLIRFDPEEIARWLDGSRHSEGQAVAARRPKPPSGSMVSKGEAVAEKQRPRIVGRSPVIPRRHDAVWQNVNPPVPSVVKSQQPELFGGSGRSEPPPAT